MKILSRKDSALMLLFLSKSPGGHAIYRQNAWVLKCEISPRLQLGWTYVRMEGRSRDYQIFLHRQVTIFYSTGGSAARESSAKNISMYILQWPQGQRRGRGRGWGSSTPLPQPHFLKKKIRNTHFQI